MAGKSEEPLEAPKSASALNVNFSVIAEAMTEGVYE